MEKTRANLLKVVFAWKTDFRRMSRKVEGSNPSTDQGFFSALKISAKDCSYRLAMEFSSIRVWDVIVAALPRFTNGRCTWIRSSCIWTKKQIFDANVLNRAKQATTSHLQLIEVSELSWNYRPSAIHKFWKEDEAWKENLTKRDFLMFCHCSEISGGCH